MARVLGYGGIGNTNGARDFTGKVEAVALGGRITNITSHFTKPTEITLWIILRLFLE